MFLFTPHNIILHSAQLVPLSVIPVIAKNVKMSTTDLADSLLFMNSFKEVLCETLVDFTWIYAYYLFSV